MRKVIYSFVVLCFSVKLVLANEIRQYGPFIVFDDIPNAVFYFSNVNEKDSFKLRNALKNETSIDTIVLMSDGGSAYEGLILSGTIHDKMLNTYVPKLEGLRSGCFSACAHMFFGGKNRWVEGSLGVHQSWTPDGDKIFSVSLAEVQQDTQNLVANTISTFNEYNVPNFVLERMFSTPSKYMHFFNKKEILEIQAANKRDAPENKKCIDARAKQINLLLKDNDWGVFKPCKSAPLKKEFSENLNASLNMPPQLKGLYKVNKCSGTLSSAINLFSIEISRFKKSFGGYNVSFLAEDGETLNFGNARIYFTASGNLTTEDNRESILLGGGFKNFTAALKKNSNSELIEELFMAMDQEKVRCSVSQI